MIAPLFRVDKPHFHTNSGSLANGWKLCSYLAGTDIPVQLYKDPEGKEKYPVEIVLNLRGEPNGNGIFADAEMRYKVCLVSSNGTKIYSVDDVGTGTEAFILEGSDTIEVTEAHKGHKTTYNAKVKDHSIERRNLKNPKQFIVDSSAFSLEEFGKDYVVLKLKKPSETGSYSLKCVNGNIGWVQDG